MRTEKMRQDNIRKVYSASADLFANCGVANTNLETIADKAGISLRSVVNYFGKKEKLIKDMRHYFVEKATNEIRDAYQQESFKTLSGREKLIEAIKIMVEYTKNKYLYICALVEMRSLETNPGEQEDEILPPILELHEFFRNFVYEGIKDGSVRNDSRFAEYIPLLIITVKGFLTQYSSVLKNKDYSSLATFENSFESLYHFLSDLLKNRI